MKSDELYPLYILFLEMRLEKEQISKGKYSLLRISESNFKSFKMRFESDCTFKDEISDLGKVYRRDKNIDNIFDHLD